MSNFFCLNLVAEHLELLNRWPDKYNACIFTFLCKLFIFRQETVTGMNGISPGHLGNSDDVIHIKIGINRFFAGTDQISFIGSKTMNTILIFFCIDCNCFEMEFMTRADNANRNFSTVSNQDFLHRQHHFQKI